MPCGFLDDPPLDPNAAIRVERSVENVRVEINPTRPLDSTDLRIHPNLFEDLAILVDRVENPAACERFAEVNVLNGAVGKPETHPITLERADGSDSHELGHGSG